MDADVDDGRFLLLARGLFERRLFMQLRRSWWRRGRWRIVVNFLLSGFTTVLPGLLRNAVSIRVLTNGTVNLAVRTFRLASWVGNDGYAPNENGPGTH